MTVKTCPVCGKEFSKAWKTICCSNECAHKQRRTVPYRKCVYCGKEFRAADGPTNIHCSMECRVRDHEQIFTCINCGKSYKPKRINKRNPKISKYCSLKCKHEYGRILCKCSWCHKEFSGQKSSENKFCSKRCKNSHFGYSIRKANNHNYRGGSVTYRGKTWKHQRNLALKRDGYKCQICQASIKRLPYGVHHIRPFRSFNGDYMTANQLTNLITLCRKCHARVEFGGLPCPQPLL